MKKKIFSIALLGLLSTLNADVISKNGIAKDSATGLEWQDDNDTKTIKRDWESAKSYCENLTLGGFNNWRLPDSEELRTLIDRKKSKEPYIVDGIKKINSTNGYWSSSSGKDGWGIPRPRSVFFNNGGYDHIDDEKSEFVRCVRAKI